MRRDEILKNTERFDECGICGQLHPHDYWGDCRDDDYRFSRDEMNEKKIRWLEEG